MANPYVNKVVYDGNTLIDLTADTVTADKLLKGYTAHSASGQRLIGTYEDSGGGGTEFDVLYEDNTERSFTTQGSAFGLSLTATFTADQLASNDLIIIYTEMRCSTIGNIYIPTYQSFYKQGTTTTGGIKYRCPNNWSVTYPATMGIGQVTLYSSKTSQSGDITKPTNAQLYLKGIKIMIPKT